MSPELAEICGIHAGDGYLRVRERNKGEVDISGHIEEKGYYDDHVIPLFNQIFRLNIKGRFFSRGSYGFVCYKRKVREVLLSFGFPAGKKSISVKVPDVIMKSNNKILYSRFLRGLFDTDGNLFFKNRKTLLSYSKFKQKYNYYPVISVTTVSNKLIKNVSSRLKQLGIKHFIYGYQPKDLRDSYKYTISINGVSRLIKWMDLIGIKNSVKFSRYQVWKKFGFCPPFTTLGERRKILKEELKINSYY